MAISIEALQFNEQGLIPAIAQDRLTGEVRMMAWMDRAAIEQTLLTKKATFFSRSRGRAWVKGEESGHFLEVSEVLADCDGDTLLVLCDPRGPSCHTGRDNCFFQPLEESQPEGSAKPLLERLEGVLEARKASTGEKSYTRSLFDGGAPKIGSKIVEEAGETVQALTSETDDRLRSEVADLLYHVLVGLRHRNLDFRGVLSVLASRLGIGGHVEKASRSPR